MNKKQAGVAWLGKTLESALSALRKRNAGLMLAREIRM